MDRIAVHRLDWCSGMKWDEFFPWAVGRWRRLGLELESYSALVGDAKTSVTDTDWERFCGDIRPVAAGATTIHANLKAVEANPQGAHPGDLVMLTVKPGPKGSPPWGSVTVTAGTEVRAEGLAIILARVLDEWLSANRPLPIPNRPTGDVRESEELTPLVLEASGGRQVSPRRRLAGSAIVGAASGGAAMSVIAFGWGGGPSPYILTVAASLWVGAIFHRLGWNN